MKWLRMKLKKIFILILSTLLLSCNRVEDEIFILPKNYTGYILVIYNQPLSGAEVQYKRGKRVYEIPSNGILKTQFSNESGLRSFSEFYYEKISLENKIPYVLPRNDIPTDSTVACCKIYGSQGDVEYTLYEVGNREQINEANKLAEMLDIKNLAE